MILTDCAIGKADIIFFQAYPEDTRQRHAVSDDLVHWEDLPLAIYPGIENCCFSGSCFGGRRPCHSYVSWD